MWWQTPFELRMIFIAQLSKQERTMIILLLLFTVYNIQPVLERQHFQINIQVPNMSQNDKESLRLGVIVLYSFQAVLFLIFLGFYIRRINKLDKLASTSNLYLPKDKTLKIRIVLIAFLIILTLVHILLSEIDQYYWMHDFKNLSLVDILGIIDLLLQIYIIAKQPKKTSERSKSIIVLWIILTIVWVTLIVIVEVYTPNTGIVLLIFVVLALAILIALTLTLDNPTTPNIEAFVSSTNASKLLPIISDAQRASFSEFHKIYIQFNKDFEVVLNDDQSFQFFFKIAVYIGGQPQIITKTQIQFLQLAKKLEEMFTNSQIVKIKLSNSLTQRRNSDTNVMKYGQQRQKIYENYLIQLTRNAQFYVEPLMNFLKINPAKRVILTQSQGSNQLLKKQSINSEELPNLSQPFFIVSLKRSKIQVSNHQILQIIINKSEAEIKLFHIKLMNEKKWKIQALPEIIQLSDFIPFIDRVVNSKHLWKSFAEWMCLGQKTADKIFNMFDFWDLGFKNIQMGIFGHKITFNPQGSVINLYLLSMTKINRDVSDVSDGGTTLQKRFKDFVKLDNSLRKFITKKNIKVQLPPLPPKVSPFGSKTSPKARLVYLDSYIKQVVRIQGINHCIQLLEFLQVDHDAVAEQFYSLEDSASMMSSGLSIQLPTRYQPYSPTMRKEKTVHKNSGDDDVFSKIKLEELELDHIR